MCFVGEADGRRKLLEEQDDDGRVPGMLGEYLAEFAKHRACAVNRIQELRNKQAGAHSGEAKAAQRALDEMESNRRQVQVQLRFGLSSATGGARQDWEQRLQDWAKEISALRVELASANEDTSRRALNLPTDVYKAIAQCPDRQSAVQSTQLLSDASDRLEAAKRQALEAEDVGRGVLSDLAAQRETIQNVRANMSIVSEELTAARRSLDRMIRVAMQNRLITMVVTFILGLGLAFYVLLVLGLPFKWNALIAIGLVTVIMVGCYVRRYLRMRKEHREAMMKQAASSDVSHAFFVRAEM